MNNNISSETSAIQPTDIHQEASRHLEQLNRQKGRMGVLVGMGGLVLLIGVFLLVARVLWGDNLWFLSGHSHTVVTWLFLSTFFLNKQFYSLRDDDAHLRLALLDLMEVGHVRRARPKRLSCAGVVVMSLVCLVMCGMSVMGILHTYDAVFTETIVMSNTFIRENESLLQGLLVGFYVLLLVTYLLALWCLIAGHLGRVARMNWLNQQTAEPLKTNDVGAESVR